MNVSCPQCSTVYRVDPAKVPAGGVRARCSTCSGVIPVGMPGASPRMTPPRSTPARSTPVRSTPVRSTPARSTPVSPAPSVPEVTRNTPADPLGAAFTPRPLNPRPFVPSGPGRSTPPVAPRTATPPGPTPQLGASLPSMRPAPRTSWPAVGTPAPGAVPSPLPEPTIAEQEAVPALAPTTAIPVVSVPAETPPSAHPLPSLSETAAPASSHPSPGSGAPAPGERRPINPFLTRDPSLRAKRLARALVSDMVAYYPAKHSEGLEKGTLKELFREEIKKSYEEYIAQVGADFARSTTHFQESLNEVLGAGKKIF
jgi:predicted Zn finger-like uncharacterized protein